jgi:hypothetical protein
VYVSAALLALTLGEAHAQATPSQNTTTIKTAKRAGSDVDDIPLRREQRYETNFRRVIYLSPAPFWTSGSSTMMTMGQIPMLVRMSEHMWRVLNS